MVRWCAGALVMRLLASLASRAPPRPTPPRLDRDDPPAGPSNHRARAFHERRYCLPDDR